MAENEEIIDASVIKAGGVFYRASRTTDGIRLDRGDSLTGTWIPLGTMQGIFADRWDYGAAEGPQWFLYNKNDWIDNQPSWGLLVDQHQKNNGYMLFRTTNIEDISQASWSAGEGVDFGLLKKRHGSVLPITMEEYQRLKSFFA
jgi:hypothetical protein